MFLLVILSLANFTLLFCLTDCTVNLVNGGVQLSERTDGDQLLLCLEQTALDEGLLLGIVVIVLLQMSTLGDDILDS